MHLAAFLKPFQTGLNQTLSFGFSFFGEWFIFKFLNFKFFKLISFGCYSVVVVVVVNA